MIPHPNAINDPKHFLGDLETLLRRYGVSIELAAVTLPDQQAAAVGGFRAARWMVAFNQASTDHQTIRDILRTYENVEAGARERQVKL